MVPRSSDVLKQDYLQSFKTRRVCFATDGKIRTATDGGGSMQKRCFKARLFAKLLNSQGFVLTRTSKLRTGTDARGSTQQRCFKARLFAKL
ncbi:hypothetical protein DWQ65_12120 [Treponema phagedenis]|nr:hypothetical protein DWQ65_12120 [Treponema phagedenis]